MTQSSTSTLADFKTAWQSAVNYPSQGGTLTCAAGSSTTELHTPSWRAKNNRCYYNPSGRALSTLTCGAKNSKRRRLCWCSQLDGTDTQQGDGGDPVVMAPDAPPPPPPLEPGQVLVTTATFQLNELYFGGQTHATSAQADAQLTQVVWDAIEAGNVDVYALTMTVLADTGSIVEWRVAVTLPTAQIGALGSRHAAAGFTAAIESSAYALGDSHVHSLYQTVGGVDASAAPVLGTAPSPPPVT